MEGEVCLSPGVGSPPEPTQRGHGGARCPSGVPVSCAGHHSCAGHLPEHKQRVPAAAKGKPAFLP